MSFAKKLGSKVFDDILGIDPSGGGIVGSVKNIADDVLGIDPSGQGLLGSIRNNPRTFGFMLGGIPGLLAGEGYKQYRKAEQQQGRETDPYAGFYNIPGMGAGGGAPIGQSAFNYARSIAGGMPFEQVVQPGREFSLESPMGEPVAPQAQVPAAPVTQLFTGIDASIGGYRDPSEMLGGVERFIGPDGRALRPFLGIDPYERLRPEEDIFGKVGDDFRPTEIRGPGGDIFGGPLGPSGRLAELLGIKDKGQDDGVYVGGSKDFREYDPLKDVERFRAPEIDPFRDGIRPTEIFGPGGEIIGPAGRMSDVQPRSDQEIIDLIEGRLGEYQPVIPQPDLSGFARLSDIPSFTPRTDEEIRGLISEGIAGIPTPAQFDPSGLLGRIGGLERQIGEIPQFDPSELQRRLAALEGREIPQFDPSGILSRLSALEAQGEPRYTQPGTEKDIVPPRSPLGKLSLFG